MLPNIVIGSEGGNGLCAAARASPEVDRHTRKHTHSATTTRTWVNGVIRQIHRTFPHGRFVNVLYYILSHGGTRRLDMQWHACAKREVKLKTMAYWNFSVKLFWYLVPRHPNLVCLPRLIPFVDPADLPNRRHVEL